MGEVVVTVLHWSPESIPEDWARVGSGYEVYVDGELMGETNAAGQLNLVLPEGDRDVRVKKIPNEAGSDVVAVEAGVTKQVTISLADDKQVFPPRELRINDAGEPLLPAPPSPVQLSFWLDDVKIPLSEILYVGVESEQNPTGIDLTGDFTLVDSVATLSQTTRLSEFLAGVEGTVTLSFDARGVDDKDYSIIVEVWPSEGSVGVEPQEVEPKAPAPMPRAQIRLRHPKSGMTVYLPEGSLEASPVAMPRGEVDVEYGIGQVYRTLTRLNLRKTERVRLMRTPNGALTVNSPETKGAERIKEPMGMLKPFVYDPENPPAGCWEYWQWEINGLIGTGVSDYQDAGVTRACEMEMSFPSDVPVMQFAYILSAHFCASSTPNRCSHSWKVKVDANEETVLFRSGEFVIGQTTAPGSDWICSSDACSLLSQNEINLHPYNKTAPAAVKLYVEMTQRGDMGVARNYAVVTGAPLVGSITPKPHADIPLPFKPDPAPFTKSDGSYYSIPSSGEIGRASCRERV